MNYEMHVADFLVWRLTQETTGLQRLLLVKCLSQETRCTAHIILNSVILHNMHSGAKKKIQIAEWEHVSFSKSMHAFTHHVIEDVRKHLNARPGICPSPCQHLISFPSVLKTLHHSSVFITVGLPVAYGGKERRSLAFQSKETSLNNSISSLHSSHLTFSLTLVKCRRMKPITVHMHFTL